MCTSLLEDRQPCKPAFMRQKMSNELGTAVGGCQPHDTVAVVSSNMNTIAGSAGNEESVSSTTGRNNQEANLVKNAADEAVEQPIVYRLSISTRRTSVGTVQPDNHNQVLSKI